jgi:ABC-type multidrug transport system fused ATPase/permease subunit
MFNTLSRSWSLVKASYNVLRSDPELMVLPFISMLGVLLVSIVFIVPAYFGGLFDNLGERGDGLSAQNILGLVVLFLYYLVMYTIIIFSNVALVGAAMMRLRGEDPTVRDGIRIAMQHLGQIVGYAAISATVGLVLKVLRDQNGLIGRILALVINVAWTVVTFLVIPVLVVENVGPIEGIKRSTELLRKTWGEQIVANGGIGLVLGLITFAVILVVGVPLVFLAAATDSAALIFVAVAIVVLLVMAISLFGAALNGVFQAALYNYASTGTAGQGFDEHLVRDAFREKKR